MQHNIMTRQQARAKARAYVKRVFAARKLMERRDYRKYKGLVDIRNLRND